jgi:FlaA1/EpsC-like NDP-sugar epimerase
MLKRAGWRLDEAEDLTGNGYRVTARPCKPGKGLPSVCEREMDQSIAQSYLNVWKQSVHKVQTKIEDIATSESVLIWGAGHHLEYLAQLTSLFRNHLRFLIVDSDPLKRGMRVHGIPVVSPDQVPEAVWKETHFPVVISSFVWRKAIGETLRRLGVNDDRVVFLYS